MPAFDRPGPPVDPRVRSAHLVSRPIDRGVADPDRRAGGQRDPTVKNSALPSQPWMLPYARTNAT